MTDTVTRWWWLRHAPVPDPEARIIGRLDQPCDVSDQMWLAALATRLPRQPVLVESGLIRCTQTIGALEAAGLVLPPAIVEADFAEQDFGLWQGRAWTEIAAAGAPELDAFRNNPAEATPPEGESFAAMIKRVAPAILRLTLAHAGRDILAVVHAGTIRSALALALGTDAGAALGFALEPLSLTRIDSVADGWRVVGVNWPPY